LENTFNTVNSLGLLYSDLGRHEEALTGTKKIVELSSECTKGISIENI